MCTLIAVHNSNGSGGRCDAKCYDAKTPATTCDCICGGVNHGAGKSRALDNTRQYAEQWIEDFKARNGIAESTIEINPETRQLSMFL